MNIPLVHQLIVLIEEILKSEAPIAAHAAISAAEQDSKVQAITAASTTLLAAAQDLKGIINAPPAPPKA